MVNAPTGAPRDHQSGLPKHRVTGAPGAALVPAGRGRWKLDSAHNPVRTTTGDQVAHPCGPGQQSLAAVMCRRTLLALLGHTVWEWREDQDALLRRVLARRPTFCDALRAFTRYRVCDRWDHWIDGMLRGLALQASLDPG